MCVCVCVCMCVLHTVESWLPSPLLEEVYMHSLSPVTHSCYSLLSMFACFSLAGLLG